MLLSSDELTCAAVPLAGYHGEPDRHTTVPARHDR